MNTTLLFDARGFDHMNGFGWGMMGFGWVTIVVVIGVLVWAIVQSTTQRKDVTLPTNTKSAEAILADRFARGEIDNDEYRTRLDTLRS